MSKIKQQNVDEVKYKGIIFRRYPNSKSRPSRYYYKPAGRYKGIEALHREIWKDKNGKIPKDCVIHHIDGNYLNNDITNLQCISKTGHRGKHPDSLEKAREAAKEWHGSKEGIEWHKKHAEEIGFGKEIEIKKCEICKQEYEGKPWQKFCSNKCKSRYRRKMGFDNVERKCEYCGEIFIINKYSKTKFCGKRCSALYQWEQGKKIGNRNKYGLFIKNNI